MRVTILSRAVDTSFDPHSSPGALSPVEPVFNDTLAWIGAPEPDGAAASQRGIADREDDLFVGLHAQHLCGMIRGGGRVASIVSATKPTFVWLIDLHGRVAAALRDSAAVSGSLTAENEIQDAAFE